MYICYSNVPKIKISFTSFVGVPSGTLLPTFGVFKLKAMQIWELVKGSDKYWVSTLGNIEGLSIWFSHDGYPKVTTFINKLKKSVFVHRLVAYAFIPNPENKECVNHINGVKTDNRIENLEWCTRSENDLHDYKIGLKNAEGEKNGRSKLSKKDVLAIRFQAHFYPRKSIALKYNISYSHTCSIINRSMWKHI